MRDIHKAEVDKIVEQEVTVSAFLTDCPAPVMFETKRDGTPRVCGYSKRLNAYAVRDEYSISRMDEFIDSLGDAKAFSTLDANSGY